MSNKQENEDGWGRWDNWCHLRANNPTPRWWLLPIAVLAAVMGIAAVAVYWLS